MPKYKVHENIQYKDDIKSDHFIEIVEGPFTGICVNFGKIEFIGEDGEGNGKINFDYDLLHIPAHINFHASKEAIEKTVGDVLNAILEDITNNEAVNETGNPDTQQSTEQ